MRPLALTALLAILVAVPVGAGQAAAPAKKIDPGITDGSKQRRLDRARKDWRQQGVKSYSYKLSRNCFCPPATNVKIVVRNGRPARGTQKDLLDQATVPRLFRTIQRAIDRKVTKLVVRYGPRGVPREIFVDGNQLIADDEIGYIVRGFAPLR